MTPEERAELLARWRVSFLDYCRTPTPEREAETATLWRQYQQAWRLQTRPSSTAGIES